MIRISNLLLLLVIIQSVAAGIPGQLLQDSASYKEFREEDHGSIMPDWLERMSLEVLPACLYSPFSNEQVNPGYTISNIDIPGLALRLGLSYRFNNWLSAKMSYMMPAAWVTYTVHPSGDETLLTRPVWMNYAGWSVNGHIPLSPKLEIVAETGVSFITRKGFSDRSGAMVIDHAAYFSCLAALSLKYAVHPSWSLVAMAGWMPDAQRHRQPVTVFAGAGISYSPVQPVHVPVAARRMMHPRQWMQIGYSGNQAGYGVNDFISGNLGVFWGGRLEVEKGLLLQYQRNIYHTPRWFALDWGVNAGIWEPQTTIANGGEMKERFFTLSVYPVFRLNFLQTKPADFYFFYSVAGPSFISNNIINGIELGEQFIFSDTMGFGAFAGDNRKMVVELRIGHYSNGNMFPSNPGVKIPLTLLAGYTF